MEITSTQSSSAPRAITPSNGSNDRHADDEMRSALVEAKAQERAQDQRALQEKLQQNDEENQRRLDGRLISFGQQQGEDSNQQTQSSFNRSRVNEAYSPPQNDPTIPHKNESANQNEADAIDIIV